MNFHSYIFFEANIFWHEHIECNKTYFLYCQILQDLDQNLSVDQLALKDNRILQHLYQFHLLDPTKEKNSPDLVDILTLFPSLYKFAN